MRVKRRVMKCACVAAALLCGAAAAVEVDGIAARVGEDAILRSDVVAEMMRAGERDGAQFANYLNDMIDRRLIIRAAAGAKMTMQEWVVENRVREIVNRAFGGDRNRLLETLARQKQSYPEWYARTKEDMIVGAMRWNVINKNITASPAEMRAEYAAHPERYVAEHRVTVSVILLKPEERVRRDAITAALKEKSFAELGGKRYADVKPEDVFKPEVCAEIAAMPKGTISKWIEIDGWSFLLRKEDEREGRRLSFEEAFDDVEANVKEEKSKAAYLAWIARLREETYVKVY